jgi:hypothetical protein
MHYERVNGEYDFAANSNLKESFLNSNEDMENIGGIRVWRYWGINSIEVLGVV